MCSLSSKSENRFLVNFQTKKPMIPMTATPPATDMPTIEPVERPFETGFGGSEGTGLEEPGGADWGTVMVTSTMLPPSAVLWITVGVGGRDGWGGGVGWDGSEGCGVSEG
jgi:hypothetical protein